MNRYPSWVNWLVLVIMVGGTLLALPNAFPDDPAVHISRADGEPIGATTLDEAASKLGEASVSFTSSEIEDGAAIIRFGNFDDQLRANDVLGDAFPAYTVAQTLAPRTPEWIQALGLRPMALGLDLRGGVQFLFQVDLEGAIRQFLGVYESTLRASLREENIRYGDLKIEGHSLLVSIYDPAQLDRTEQLIRALDNNGTLASRLVITPTAAFRGDSTQFETPLPILDQKAYWLYNLGMSWTAPNGHYKIGVYGLNLSDERYKVGGYNFPGGTYGNTTTAFYGAPKTWTVSLEYKY